MSTGLPRVLMIIGSMREGGAEGQVVLLVRELVRRGWPVAVMLLRREGVRLADLEATGCAIHHVDLPYIRPRWSPAPWLGVAKARAASRAFVQEWRPEVVHCWLFWAHLWGHLITPSNVPLVTSRRQTFSDKGNSRLLMAMERRISRRGAAIVANAEAVAHAAARAEGNPQDRYRVIYNGIDMEAIDAAPAMDLRREFPGLAESAQIAVTVANLLPHKGYDGLLTAWRQVLQLHPRAALLCVGADGGIQRALEDRVRNEGMAGHLVFAGPRRDVPALLKGADLAVHASDDEGFSNAVAEYMACGLPVVATDAGGNAELLAPPTAGIVVPRGRPSALAEGLGRLLSDEDLRRRLGAAAARRARQQFTLDAMVNSHVLLYKSLAGGLAPAKGRR